MQNMERDHPNEEDNFGYYELARGSNFSDRVPTNSSTSNSNSGTGDNGSTRSHSGGDRREQHKA